MEVLYPHHPPQLSEGERLAVPRESCLLLTMRSDVLLAAAALFALAEGLCQSYEKTYYEEIGCRPETVDPSGCPTSYDCSTVAQRPKGKCHLNGKEYNPQHKLDYSPFAACLVECRCLDNEKGASFNCISIECPEHFIGPPAPNCYRTYEHGRCCHKDEICGQGAEQKSPRPTCQYQGNTLQLGEKFYPEDKCLQCICQPGFNGSLVEPYCSKVQCNLELVDGMNIAQGCVPVYYGDNGCCPIYWRCPEESDKVLPSNTKYEATSVTDKVCRFGKVTMRVGERLGPGLETDEDVECECRVPPHPVCIQREQS